MVCAYYLQPSWQYLFRFRLLYPPNRVNEDSAFIADNYTKTEIMIPMRDGVRLFTSIYIPKDENEKYPFLIKRTPYSCAPYGEKNFSTWGIGPSKSLMHEKYIFVEPGCSWPL